MIPHSDGNFLRNTPICHGCPVREGGRCGRDHVDLASHANADYCPDSRFGSGREPDGWPPPAPLVVNPPPQPKIPLAGDIVEKVAQAVGADKLAAWWSENVTRQPCHCSDRKKWLNEKSQALLKWAGLR